MLSKYEIEQLKKGSFGVLRDGTKAKYLGEYINGRFVWAQYDEQDKISLIVADYDDFQFYMGSASTSQRDVIGLWGDKPEPFDLERALAGEPIFNDNVGSGKAYLRKSSFDDETFIVEYKTAVGLYDISQLNIGFKMWKEPEPVNQRADDLPKPIREFGDLTEVWYLSRGDECYIPRPSWKLNRWDTHQIKMLNNNVFYATEEDCQLVCNWLMNR